MRKFCHPCRVDGALAGMATRRLTTVLVGRLNEEPTVVLTGPRTVGKSTLLGVLALRLGKAVIDCDDPATRAAVRNDPGRFVAGPTRYLSMNTSTFLSCWT